MGLDRLLLAAEPIEGVTAASLATTIDSAAPDIDTEAHVRDEYAVAYGWLSAYPPFDRLRSIDDIERACVFLFADTAGVETVTYLERIDNHLQQVDSYSVHPPRGEAFDYIGREYGMHIDDPRGRHL